MDILLDTHTLIWALLDDDKMSQTIKNLIDNPSNDIFFSVASLWEIEIKHAKHPQLMPYSMKQIYNVILGKTDFIMLDIRPEYLVYLSEIINENIHNDPFDHLIISMAKSEKMKLITHDAMICKYQGIDVVLI